MTKQLYIIDYESSQWCGGQSHVCAWAEDADTAEFEAEFHMDDAMRELFSSEYDDEDSEGNEEEPAYTVNSVEVLDENNEHWKFYQDPGQSEFYPVIGEPD